MKLVPIGRIDLASVAAFVLATFVVTLALAGPRVIDRDAADALAYAFNEAPVSQTGLRTETVVDMGSLDPLDPFTPHPPIHTRFGPAPQLEPYVPPSMFAAPELGHASLDIPGFIVTRLNDQLPAFTMKISVRIHDDFERLVTIVSEADEPPVEESDDSDAGPPVVDVLLTEATADLLQVSLGDVLELRNDSDAPITRSYQSLAAIATMRVAGFVELATQEDPAWFGDDRLHLATRNDTHNGFEVSAYVTIAPSDFASSPWATHDGGLAMLTQSQTLQADPPTVAEEAGWVAELHRMDAASVGRPAVGEPIGRSQLGGLLAEFASARVAAERIVMIMLFGLGALALLTAARLVQHAMFNRRLAFAVLRSRGTSISQLVFTTLILGATLGAAAAALGSVLSLAVSPTVVSVSQITIATASMAGGAALVLALIVAGFTRSDLAIELTAAERPPGPAQRSVDLVVLAIAAIGVVTVIRRTATTPGFDRVGATTFVALAIGCGIIGRRALRLLSSRLRVPWLAGDLAARRISSGRSTSLLIIDAVALAAALVGVAASVDAAQRAERIDASWMRAAAPLRVEAQLGTQLDEAAIASVPGVSVVAGETTIVGPLTVGDEIPAVLTLLALDSAELRPMITGDPAQPLGDVDLASMLEGGRIPALVPLDGVGNGPIALGTFVQGVGALKDASMQVVGTHEARQASGPTVVVDRSLLEGVLGRSLGARAASVDGTADAQTLEAVPGVARVIVRADQFARLENDPLNRGVSFGLRFVLVMSVALVLVLVAFGAALVSSQRRTQSALLAAVGAPPSVAVSAVTQELLFALCWALLAGVGATAIALRALDPLLVGNRSTTSGAAFAVFTLPLAVAVGTLVVLSAAIATMMTRRANARDTARTLRNELI